jgi:hypothetical protein
MSGAILYFSLKIIMMDNRNTVTQGLLHHQGFGFLVFHLEIFIIHQSISLENPPWLQSLLITQVSIIECLYLTYSINTVKQEHYLTDSQNFLHNWNLWKSIFTLLISDFVQG